MTKSNYIFRGTKYSIKEHYTGEWEIIDNTTGQILFLVDNQDKALEEYDRLNSSVSSENKKDLCFDVWKTSGDELVEVAAKFFSLELAKDFVDYQDTLGNSFVVLDKYGFMIYGFLVD